MQPPNALLVYLTSRCNLSCKFCTAKRDDVVASRDVTPELVEKVLDFFPSFRIAGIGGNGEPLIATHLPEVVRCLRNKITRLRMTTNGVLIDARLDDVPWSMFDEVSVSVNEVDAQRYRVLCGADRLDDVTSGIQALLKQKTAVNISFVLSKTRLNRIGDYLAYAKSLGVPLVQLFNMMPLVPGADWRKQLDEDVLFDDPEVVDEFRSLRELARTMRVNVRWPLLVRRDGHGADCQEPWSMLAINGDGDIAVCCRGPGPRPDVGNIHQHGKDAWTSEYARSLRKSINDKKWFTKCVGCKFRYKNVQPEW